MVVTLMDDERVLRTLYSLRCQSMKPCYVFVADGSGGDVLFNRIEKLFPFVNIKKFYGTVAMSRYKTMRFLFRYSWDVVVFIDSDQYASKDWLRNLVKPIVDGRAGFTCGCETPVSMDGSRVERYINRRRRRIVGRDQRFFSMGNTAWSRSVFECIGNFNPCIGWGGEDYDVNLRATSMGFKGVFVRDAWVVHDYPEKTLGRWIGKRLKYHTGTTMCYLNNKVDLVSSRSVFGFGLHPLDWVDRLLKVFGFLRGCFIYRCKLKGGI